MKTRVNEILNGMNSSNWCKPSAPLYSIGLVVYVVLVIFFAYFYTSIQFNPDDISKSIQQNGHRPNGHKPSGQHP